MKPATVCHDTDGLCPDCLYLMQATEDDHFECRYCGRIAA